MGYEAAIRIHISRSGITHALPSKPPTSSYVDQLDDDGRRLDVNDGQELVGGVAQDTGRGLEELGRALVTAGSTYR